jgi:hypothetical protein
LPTEPVKFEIAALFAVQSVSLAAFGFGLFDENDSTEEIPEPAVSQNI